MYNILQGIYIIENVNARDDSPRFYVGKAIDIFQRLNQHCIGSTQYIDRTIVKEGVTNFLFSVLEVVKKEADLDSRENYWIKSYGEKYGNEKLYNIKLPEIKNNLNPTKPDSKTKKEIEKLFQNEINRSIYSIAEKYNLDWNEIVKIRKPILKQQGYKWNKKKRCIVDSNDNKPEKWNGGRITQKQLDYILANFDKEPKDLSIGSKMSPSDLNLFKEEYKNSGNNYKVAPNI